MDARAKAGLRPGRVLENETRILRAARELFVRGGYQATTLTAVAERAGVAHRTVYVRFGTKAGLLARVVDLAIAGDLRPIDVEHRDRYVQALSAPTLDERISVLAKGSSRLLAAAADVIAVARQAESTEPSIAEQARAGRATTRRLIRAFWKRAHEDGLLPPTVDLDWLAETTAALAHAETYLVMRETAGFTPRRHEKWFVTTWHRAVRAASDS